VFRASGGQTGSVTDQHDHYRAFPADGFEARWTTWDGEHTEHLTIRWENEAWTVSGRPERERVEYVIRLSPLWHVRQFLLFRDLAEPDLWLGTDGQGRWGEMNGAHRPELDGAHDVALDVTPFTLSLPIRRLPLHVGDAFELTVLAIDVETLAVVPTAVAYHRTADRRWRITRGGETTSEVTVDEFGLAIDVEGAFRRV
jgi:uncharacterized protein